MCYAIVYFSSKASLFEDLTPGGALCHIMTTAYRMKTEQSWYAMLDINCVPTLPYTSYCTHDPDHHANLELLSWCVTCRVYQ